MSNLHLTALSGFVLLLFAFSGCSDKSGESPSVSPQATHESVIDEKTFWVLFLEDKPIAVLRIRKHEDLSVKWSGQTTATDFSHCNGMEQLLHGKRYKTIASQSDVRIDLIEDLVDFEFYLLGDGESWTDWVYADDCENLSGRVERAIDEGP